MAPSWFNTMQAPATQLVIYGPTKVDCTAVTRWLHDGYADLAGRRTGAAPPPDHVAPPPDRVAPPFGPRAVITCAGSARTQTLVRAATRTEEVHYLLADTLPQSGIGYFRFQPQLPYKTVIDETSLDKLRELQAFGRELVSHGEGAAQMMELARVLLKESPAPVAGVGAAGGADVETR